MEPGVYGGRGGALCFQGANFPACSQESGEQRASSAAAAQGQTFNVALKHSWRGEGGYRSLGMTCTDLITEDVIPCFQQTDLSSCAAEKIQKNPTRSKSLRRVQGVSDRGMQSLTSLKGPQWLGLVYSFCSGGIPAGRRTCCTSGR